MEDHANHEGKQPEAWLVGEGGRIPLRCPASVPSGPSTSGYYFTLAAETRPAGTYLVEMRFTSPGGRVISGRQPLQIMAVDETAVEQKRQSG